ncbi:hypothetical protein GCM10025867_20990 [Frondihabitans sucicola]|uniref:Uncharacterized protein n=1 Tax=Frondihabitans sucicola TaxID=1268041 RepID=A0ABN6XY21_9MICO|nr:hypothetical protein GCM10025867_20990 [Frondihabitans sucicola]
MAKRAPPTLRMTSLAPASMSRISSGACSPSTFVSESAMEAATGSANWVQTGMLARAHSARVISRGATVSSATWATSSSQRAATWKACSSELILAGDVSTADSAPMLVA